ncbi:hypothetical protein MSG28_008336 [Choristoneura fumiferana]|uniref:Uncharacterized protein n=1 Tax=Choristoneura fumiferana TaxID=7141 RepID=A0ACC0JB04_CHOFU|nr:hypothetical protein MSG28_008336 [Choristoneura fumiferana]
MLACFVVIMAMGIDIFGLGIIVTASTCDLGMTLQQIGVLSSMPFAALSSFAPNWQVLASLRFISSAIESPKFLANVGRTEDAVVVLRRMYEVNGGKGEYPVKEIFLEEGTKEEVGVFSLRSLWMQIAPLFKPPLLGRTLLLYYLTFVVYIARASLAQGSATSSLWAATTLQPSKKSARRSARTQLTTIRSGRAAHTASAAAAGIDLTGEPLSGLFLFYVFLTTAMVFGVISSYFVTLYPTSYRGMVACLGMMVARLSAFSGTNIVSAAMTNHCSGALYGACGLVLKFIKLVAYAKSLVDAKHTYRTISELRSNEDVELDLNSGVIRYTPHVNIEFVPEESIGDPKKMNVTIPNIAMLSMTSMMSSYPFWTRMGYNVLQQQVKSKSIITVTAHDYLWGYDEALITAGNTFMPGWIHFPTMGIMDRLYDKTVENRLEVGATDVDKFVIKSMNGLKGLKAWGYEDNSTRSKCNSFHNAYEGIAYPDDLTPATEIRIFRNVLCRFLELDFVEQKTMDFGAEALVYKISNKTYSLNPENECLCTRGICIDGISDISPCFYGLPLAISNAHFLDSDPKVYERLDGLNPDPEKHGGKFLIEPQIGAVIETQFTVQVNIVMGDVGFNQEAKHFSNMVVPVGYFQIILPDLPEHTKSQLNLMYIIGPKIFLSIEVALFVLGSILILYTIFQVCKSVCTDHRKIAFQTPTDDKKATILCVPLMDLDSRD